MKPAVSVPDCSTWGDDEALNIERTEAEEKNSSFTLKYVDDTEPKIILDTKNYMVNDRLMNVYDLLEKIQKRTKEIIKYRISQKNN
ncbi:unnamed protein product [Adineta steineri]|uniref:Uncharacterized protein n=1 Tax=Adineta steineri TaxID=433720 RepID=A0A819VSD0_9BILA|nr:unnamed protein product [Adineta steineri]CAF4113540.1 unnamed protein product [Adineta steineri]